MRAASARRGAALACAVVAAAGGAMAADLPPLTQRDDGRTIELRVGDRLALELPQIAGTGFGWAPDGPVPVAIERLMSRPGSSGFGQAMALSCVLVLVCGLALSGVDLIVGRVGGRRGALQADAADGIRLGL